MMTFKAWGWRVPFLLSVFLLAISVYIRLKLSESPLFAEMKAQGRHSRAPLTESFGNWRNLKIVLLALFGATAGQGVVWYTGQFYALFFLQNTLKVDFRLSYVLVAVALLIGTPFFIFFGRLSDRIGRKPIIVTGCLLAALTFIPDLQGTHALRESGARRLRGSRRGHRGRARLPLQHLRQACPRPAIARKRFPDQGGPELHLAPCQPATQTS